MPTRRLSSTSLASEPRRRRSSHLLQPLHTIKPGMYGLQSRPIAFAPNVTPGTFVEPENISWADLAAPTTVLFPPSEKPAQPATRKRLPPGKRPSQGYIPRPPNAFMLFRADFVKQRHVPGSIETNHGSLSKIIGNCWRQLPLDEKRYWEQRAKEEKQQHKIRHPDYRFRPVHNKNKKDCSKGASSGLGKKDKPLQAQEEELRCDAVAALLLEGKKGDELAQAVRDLDNAHKANVSSFSREGTLSARDSFSSNMATPPPPYFFQPTPQYGAGVGLRRPSSVPLPVDGWLSGLGSTIFSPAAQYPNSSLTLPHVPFMTSSRPVSPSPITGISFAAQQHQYQERVLRRPSSAQPIGMAGRRSWSTPTYDGYATMPFLQDLGIANPYSHLQSGQQHEEPEIAGEPDYTLFNGFSFSHHPGHSSSGSQDGLTPTGTNALGPHDLPPPLNIAIDQLTWTPREVDSALDSATSMVSSSAATVSSPESSPAPSDSVLDIYAPTGSADNGMFTRPDQMFGINGNYDMDLTSFDISPLNMPVGMAASSSYPSDIPYSYDASGLHGIMDSAGMDPILHAPKPLLSNERTPTKAAFGEDLDNYTAI